MELTIKTDPKRYFRQLLEILSFTPLFKNLSSREKDVLAEILMYSWIYRAVPDEERWILINSPDIKEKMRMKLGVSKEGLNNLFTTLRKKDIITFSGVVPKYSLVPSSSLTIKFHNDADR
jgi:hypothetical protein